MGDAPVVPGGLSPAEYICQHLATARQAPFKPVVGYEFNISTAEEVWATLILRGMRDQSFSIGEHQVKLVTG